MAADLSSLVAAPASDFPFDGTDLRRFFRTLYQGQTGRLEVRTFDHPDANRLRDFIPVVDGATDYDRVDRFVKATIDRQIGAYFGVALRTEDGAKTKRGDAPHCLSLTAAFVDADDKHHGREETIRRLNAFPLRFSLAVDSGGGLHPYWLLQEPLDLQTHYEQARTFLRALAHTLSGVVDESVSEPARVLRIPGSFNFKKMYPEPRRVKLYMDDEEAQ